VGGWSQCSAVQCSAVQGRVAEGRGQFGAVCQGCLHGAAALRVYILEGLDCREHDFSPLSVRQDCAPGAARGQGPGGRVGRGSSGVRPGAVVSQGTKVAERGAVQGPGGDGTCKNAQGAERVEGQSRHQSIHYTLYTIHYTLYTIHYTLYTIHYTQYTIHYTLYTIPYGQYYTQAMARSSPVCLYSLIFPWSAPWPSAPCRTRRTRAPCT
jgi:hypothetical protein